MSIDKQTKKISEILIEIGKKINEDPKFLDELSKFMNSPLSASKQIDIDIAKINSLDLFQLIRENTEEEVEDKLSDFNIKELREILKKYRFGSPSTLRTTPQIKKYILNQLMQRKTDVFRSNI